MSGAQNTSLSQHRFRHKAFAQAQWEFFYLHPGLRSWSRTRLINSFIRQSAAAESNTVRASTESDYCDLSARINLGDRTSCPKQSWHQVERRHVSHPQHALLSGVFHAAEQAKEMQTAFIIFNESFENDAIARFAASTIPSVPSAWPAPDQARSLPPIAAALISDQSDVDEIISDISSNTRKPAFNFFAICNSCLSIFVHLSRAINTPHNMHDKQSTVDIYRNIEDEQATNV